MRIITSFIERTRHFGRDDTASLSVEAVLILPILLWAFLATFTFFDIYRAKNLSLKANYAVSDLLSRETNAVNTSYLLGLEKVFQYLTQGGDPAWIRVTVVHCSQDCATVDRQLVVDWSHATDQKPQHTSLDVKNHYDRIIPVIASGERLIMVETSTNYSPPFSQSLTGITARQMTDIVMTRPRFAPQLLWSGV